MDVTKTISNGTVQYTLYSVQTRYTWFHTIYTYACTVLRFTIHGILQSIFSSLKTVGTIFCEHPLLLYYLYPLCPQKHPQFPLGESSMPQSKKGQQKKVPTLEKTTVLCRSTFFISLQYG